MAFALHQASHLDGSNLNHPSLKKIIISEIAKKLPDESISIINSISILQDLSNN